MSGPTILVVDDREHSRTQIGRRLRKRGYAVVEAADGLEGWSAFEASRPAAVVTDVRMPNADGLELLERIRATGAVPVFCITAYPDLDTGRLAMKRGAEFYYRWPVELDQMLDDIDASLRQRRPDSTQSDEAASLAAIRTLGRAETDVERRESILAALRETRGNVLHAATLLQISRRTLYHWMARYKVKVRE